MKKTVLLVCLAVAVCSALAGQQAVEKPMCEKKVQVLLDKVLELWNKPDLALIPELYAADCIAQTSTMPEPYVGFEGIKAWVENTRAMMPDLKMTFEEAVVQGEKVATAWTMTGTHTGPMPTPMGVVPPTGKKVRITGLAIDTMKDGKFQKEVVVFNVLEMMMQMGFQLLPPKGE